MSNMTLSEMAALADVKFAPDAVEMFKLAKEENPKLNLDKLSPEDKAVLDGWFKRYYGMQVTQVYNLRKNLNSPLKHLSLDLVALCKPEVREAAGLSEWFPNSTKRV